MDSHDFEKKNVTDLAIKRHIVHHAKEIFEKEPAHWAASMRNLVEIFEEKKKVKPSTSSRLKKLENKYYKNPKRYTPPPKVGG